MIMSLSCGKVPGKPQLHQGNRCMQDEATEGKMTLGLDISSDLKDERWSFNLRLFVLKRWTQRAVVILYREMFG